MKITLDEAAKEKLSAHLDSNKQLLLTFEDGVGPVSYTHLTLPTKA